MNEKMKKVTLELEHIDGELKKLEKDVRKRKPRRPKPSVPESGTLTAKRRFRMKMDVIFRGKIYTRDEQAKKQLPAESQEYLRRKGWEE